MAIRLQLIMLEMFLDVFCSFRQLFHVFRLIPERRYNNTNSNNLAQIINQINLALADRRNAKKKQKDTAKQRCRE